MCDPRIQHTHHSFSNLFSIHSLAALRFGDLSDDLSLPRTCYLTVTAKGREHLFMSEILTPGFELFGRDLHIVSPS